MSISSEYSNSTDTLKIRISGHFDFDSHQEFRNCYKNLPVSQKTKYIIDLRKVEHMDSAALGMLLVLRERSGADKSKIILEGANKDVLKILDIARFEQLFTIS